VREEARIPVFHRRPSLEREELALALISGSLIA
jgi:hypothetical protein